VYKLSPFSERCRELLRESQYEALDMAARAALWDLVDSGTMPYRTGWMQWDTTYQDNSDLRGLGVTRLCTSAEYAYEMYTHPEYGFNRDHNAYAGAYWFAPYVYGPKLSVIGDTYGETLRRVLERKGFEQ
jgi:hypothetical protein